MKRDEGIELARIIASIAVIAIHAYAFSRNQFRESSLHLLVPYIEMASFAVPLFFIISGYLVSLRLRNKESHEGLLYIFAKSWQIYKIYWIWAIVFLVFQTVLNPRMIYWRIREISFFQWVTGPGTSAHLWFLPVLALGLFSVYIAQRCKNDFILIIFSLLSYVVVLALGCYKEILLFMPVSLNNNYIAGCSFLLMGATLARGYCQNCGIGKSLLYTIVGASITLAESLYFCKIKGCMRIDFLDFLIGTPFFAIGIFLLCKAVAEHYKDKISSIAQVGIMSLGVYLIHPILISFLGPYISLKWSVVSPWVTLNLIVAASYGSSLLLARMIMYSKLSWMLK
jgi:surface polysaccharide O-acyltransferase-like enzyme